LVSLCWLALSSRRRDGLFDAWLTDTVVALGPAYVKAAQLLGTRADLLSPRVCRALSRLYDSVRPMPSHAAAELLSARFPETPADLVGSGSIACVYRLGDVAVKLRRPGIERALTRDLAVMRKLTRVLSKAPMLRGVPVVDIVDQVTESVHAQLDLTREADALKGFREAMSSVAGVTVPAVRQDMSTEDSLVMEFVDGLARRSPAELAEPESQLAVLTALRAVYRMLFLDGVVHCDLHPGNLYFRADGTIVILDAGFTVKLTDVAREKFAAFFYCMSQGDGEACADIVLSTAQRAAKSDAGRFRVELVTLIEASAGRPAAEFDLVSFSASLFNLQRRYGFYADPQFVFPILSLLVLEGTIRRFHPAVDFQGAAKPFLMTALIERVLVAGKEKTS
jgi:ubiquinone biosynthesis protein